ncbi:MAG: glycosyltransferase family 4 protein [Candidatus Delongbacteria bacterium]|nr:glycosyltransferase family 4 protein [Candidatus Delongbacteria bacterium]MCG2761174.1 glycosyltransferase family 4 protein [Candidatus Delongbacteria bacterium]
MNILFLSAKKRWAGVLTWYVSISRKLEADGHKCFIISAKHSAFTEHCPKDINLIPLKFGFNYNPLTLIFLYRFLRKNKIDLVVTNIKREVIFGGVTAKLLGIPVIRRIGNERDFINCKIQEQKLVSKDLFVCNYTRDLVLKKYNWLSREKTIVIHTGKFCPEFSKDEILAKRKSWEIGENDIVIGISDRISEAKGIHFLLNAFSELKKEFSNIKLVITGKGNYENVLKNSVTELKLEDSVIFAGFTTEVMLTASSYDIAVLSSFYESFPNTVVEYLASGTPVVCTNVGGVSEIVEDARNGFIVAKNNSDQLVFALHKLISDQNLRSTFSKNALETIKNGFTEDIMYAKTLELFNMVIENK